MLGHKERDLPLPPRIVKGHRERLGLVQHPPETRKVAEGAECRAQGKAEVDGLLARVTRRWQLRQDAERLLEIAHGLAVGGPCDGLLPGLPAVRKGLVPDLAPEGMGGQAVDVVGQAVARERFQCLHDPRMQRPPPLLGQTAVRHFVSQGVLEGVGVLRKQVGLVQELGRLEVPEAVVQRVLGQLGDRLQQGKGTSVPITAAVCSRRFTSGGRRSIRAASTACTVAGTCMVGRACARR